MTNDQRHNERRRRQILEERACGQEPTAFLLLAYVQGDDDAAIEMSRRLGEQRDAVNRRILRSGQTCHRCGKRFEPRHIRHRFCSDACR